MRLRLDHQSPVLQDSELFAQVARIAIQATIIVNRSHLHAFPGTPRLYQSGVRYRLEPPGTEDVADIEVLLDRGWGDCAQLCAWRVAELRVLGEPAKIRIQWKVRPDGKKLFHVLVRRADGRIEDPSTILGMKSGDAVTVDRKPMIGYERKDL